VVDELDTDKAGSDESRGPTEPEREDSPTTPSPLAKGSRFAR
jgi:hypothetical protein